MLSVLTLFTVLAAADGEAEPSCPAKSAVKARAAFEAGDIAGTLAATQDVERCETGTGKELAEALRWRAQAVATKENERTTVTAFAWVNAADPAFVADPPLPPGLQELFLRGREQAQADKLVLLRLLAPAADESAAWVRVEVLGFGEPSLVEAVFREKLHVTAVPEGAGVYRAKVPAGRAAPYRFRAVIDRLEFTSLSGKSPAVSAAAAPQGNSVEIVESPRVRSRPSRLPWIPLGLGVVLAGSGIVSLLVGNGMLLPISQGDMTITTVAQLDARVGQATTLQTYGVVALSFAGVALLTSVIWLGYDRKHTVTVSLVPGGGASFGIAGEL
jgi:hypothetical protein